MSQDLFAAFGAVAISENDSRLQHDGKVGKRERLSIATTDTIDDQGEDDDFGDFEDAAAMQAEPPMAVPYELPSAQQAQTSGPVLKSHISEPRTNGQIGRHPFADHMDFLFSGGDDEYNAGADDLDDLSRNPEAAMAYSKRLIAERERDSIRTAASPASHVHRSTMQSVKTNATPRGPPTLKKSGAEPRVRNKLKKKSGYVPAKDPNILFDADEAIEQGVSDTENDDFGDFEFAAMPADSASRNPATHQNLLDLDTSLQPTKSTSSILPPRPSASSQTKTQELNSPSKAPSKALVAAVSEPDDTWDDFEVAEPANTASQVKPVTQHQVHKVLRDDKPYGSNGPHETINALPPTNIPPPASLLTIFPPLLSTAQQTILEPLAKLGAAQRQELLLHPSTVKFLHRHIVVATVLGHIIAGRKLRWKRDQLLTQSMRIGPAAAGGKGGMKLAGVDKSEVVKEDREVIDTVRVWKAQVTKLRSAVTAAAPHTSLRLSSIPEISEQIPVKVLKAIEGGFVAPHACALCGLRREERAAKVDVDVDDSFGEWWVQSMSMHLSCRNFWEENKEKLRSR